METKKHQTENPRESMLKSDLPIIRDIGRQLNMLERNAPLEWQDLYKSFLGSKKISIEVMVRQLNRKGETEKLEALYDLIIGAIEADYSANDNFKISANNFVEEIVKLAA